MGECAFNGTCSQCTRTGLEYVKTFDKLVCCVTDTSVVPGWIEVHARTEEECPDFTRVSSLKIFLIVLGVFAILTIAAGLAYWGYRRWRYQPIHHVRLPAAPQTSTSNWEQIELHGMPQML